MKRTVRAYVQAFCEEGRSVGLDVHYKVGGHAGRLVCRSRSGEERVVAVHGSPRCRSDQVRQNAARQDARRIARLLGHL